VVVGGTTTKVILDVEDIPTHFYNILPDLPEALPPPKENLEILGKIFPKGMLAQEFATERYIPIPEEIRHLLAKIGRPTPLQRALALEKALGTPARIYFKREDTTVTGSHKINSALMQAYLAKNEGFETVTTETGAGQWGSALALACKLFGLKCVVKMVRCSYEQKPYRKYIMQLYGAKISPSPSKETEVGKHFLKDPSNKPGSLGMAIAEAVELAEKDDKTCYSLGSVLNAVLLHQSIIGLETMKQLEKINEKPDVLIGCVGGGSNYFGFIAPFYRDYKNKLKYVAVEPKTCPTMTKGDYKYDYGDSAKIVPQLMMYTLDCEFKPPVIHAGGLRYHGMAPIMSALKKSGVIEAKSYTQEEIFDAGKLFAETESIIPAPESCHAIKAAIDEALECKKTGEEKVIVFNLSGHGLLDLQGYADVLGLSSSKTINNLKEGKLNGK